MKLRLLLALVPDKFKQLNNDLMLKLDGRSVELTIKAIFKENIGLINQQNCGSVIIFVVEACYSNVPEEIVNKTDTPLFVHDHLFNILLEISFARVENLFTNGVESPIFDFISDS